MKSINTSNLLQFAKLKLDSPKIKHDLVVHYIVIVRLYQKIDSGTPTELLELDRPDGFG